MTRTFLFGSAALLSAALVAAQARTGSSQQQQTAVPPPATGSPAPARPAARPAAAQAPIAVAVPAAPTAASIAAQRALLDQYCVTCHSDKVKRANFSLENLDLTTAGDNPELWEKVIRKLRAGVMPPP